MTSALAHRVLERWYAGVSHPYRLSERLSGTGRVEFSDLSPGIEPHDAELGGSPLEDGCVDPPDSCHAFDHVTDPGSGSREIQQVRRPGGRVVFLPAVVPDCSTLVVPR